MGSSGNSSWVMTSATPPPINASPRCSPASPPVGEGVAAKKIAARLAWTTSTRLPLISSASVMATPTTIPIRTGGLPITDPSSTATPMPRVTPSTSSMACRTCWPRVTSTAMTDRGEPCLLVVEHRGGKQPSDRRRPGGLDDQPTLGPEPLQPGLDAVVGRRGPQPLGCVSHPVGLLRGEPAVCCVMVEQAQPRLPPMGDDGGEAAGALLEEARFFQSWSSASSRWALIPQAAAVPVMAQSAWG
jgi:hypothetical protein